MFMDIDDVLNQNPYGVIYCLTCKTNGKVYIGKTTDFRDRMNRYKGLHCKGQPLIYEALKRHGTDNFSYDILDMTTNEELLNFLEDFYIETIGSRREEIGYNDKTGGRKGKHSEKTKGKISKALKGNTHCKGRKLTKKTKNKIAKAHTGKIFSEEAKIKMSNAKKGRKHSEETKAKMSNSAKNRNKTKQKAEQKRLYNQWLEKKRNQLSPKN